MVRVFQRYGVNRTNHVSHSDYYINWGEPIISLIPRVGSEPIGKKYDKQLQNGECQMNDRQSDKFIVPMKLSNANRGKGLT